MQSHLRLLQLSLGAALLSLPAAAQGSDNCATATLISGTGTFAVSTVGSTTSTQQSGACPTAFHDVWFLWTAPVSEGMSLSTCGATTTDTVVAIYAGPLCPASGTEINCSDDACDQQSQIFFSAVAGNSYLIQIGAWSSTATFTATFNLVPATAPCNLSSGPDVIVGTIGNVQNTTALNGLDAFTLGATACNAGNAVINWIGPTNEHPLIGETFYKYKVVAGSGRFEQIGMSWLKHGFASDITDICCTCQPPADNQHMGVGCSDTYSAGQAGSQSGLTPRWQVNAHTGYFPYPGANPPWSGNTARRCEVLISDLEPSTPSVQYFAEVTYTTADDALAGNGNNNGCYVGMSVTGTSSNYTFATLGASHAMQDAIRAWPTLESGVTLSDVQVSNDGLFIVGSKATDLGGGTYHYEYAVHNVNSYLAGGTFSVPIPVGAVLSNIGFHDITYRNGDGLNNVSQTDTDWPAVQAGGALTWSCQTPAQDPNANAIRWATTYNFRFDANIAPVSGSVALGLWNVSSPLAVPAAATVPDGNGGIVAFCAGDGSLAPCPCANTGLAGRGCNNSAASGGAVLSGSGVASVSADTLLLTANAELPAVLSVVMQGSASGAPVVFGDGLRCLTGGMKRLYQVNAVAGSINVPAPTDLPITARSAQKGDHIPVGGVRVYMVYYRDPDPFFCPIPTGNTFNATNAVSVTWGP